MGENEIFIGRLFVHTLAFQYISSTMLAIQMMFNGCEVGHRTEARLSPGHGRVSSGVLRRFSSRGHVATCSPAEV